MYKRLLIFLMLLAVSSANIFAEGIPPGAGTADCTDDVLGQDSGAVNLVASVTPNQYNVIYATDSNGSGTGVQDTNIVFNTTDYVIKSEGTGTGQSGITSNVGYYFTGWLGTSDDSEYVSTTYQPDDEFTPYDVAGNLTLTAQHARNVTTVQYVCENTQPSDASTVVGGTTPENGAATYGQQFVFATNTCTLDGYDFGGWSCVGASGTTGLNPLYASSAEVASWEYTGENGGNITCSATWAQQNYAITYDCGDAVDSNNDTVSPSEPSTSVTMDGTYVLESNDNCSWDGYVFAGWSCPNLPGTPTLPSGSLNPQYFTGGATGSYAYAGNITCTAQWEGQSYKITYQGGTAGGQQVSQIEQERAVRFGGITYVDSTGGDLKTLPANTFSIAGYSFDKWDSTYNVISGVAATQQTPVLYDAEQDISPYGVHGDTVMTAIWNANSYTVKYDTDSNGTGPGIQDGNIQYGITDYTIRAEDTSGITPNTGYRFTGWLGSSDDSEYVSTTYQPGYEFTPYNIAGDLTLTAQHEGNVTTIQYFCENTQPSGASTQVGGSTPVNGFATYGQEFVFATNTCTLDEYEFAGWACAGVPGTTGLNPPYASGEHVALWEYTGEDGGVVMCRATWRQIEHHINYDCDAVDDNGSPILPNIPYTTVTMGGQYQLEGWNNCVWTGHLFQGWFCALLPGINDDYIFAGNASGTYNYNGDVTCIAQWNPANYKITYKPGMAGNNPVSGVDRILPVVFGGFTYNNDTQDPLETLPANTFSAVGYNFKGWDSTYNVPTGVAATQENPVLYNAEYDISPYRVSDNTEMTAIWTPKRYTVFYNDGNDVVYTDVDGAVYDENYSVPADADAAINAPAGYIFVGWNTEPARTTSNFPDSLAQPWTRDSNLTVYAAYDRETYNISYDCGSSILTANFATGEISSTSIQYNGTYELDSGIGCSLAGYNFDGWLCPNLLERSGTEISPDQNQTSASPVPGGTRGTYNYAGNVTCTAQWKQTRNLVRYDCGFSSVSAGIHTSGAPSPSYESVLYDSPYTVKQTKDNCNVPGHDFLGWRCDYNLGNGSHVASYYVAVNGVVPFGDATIKNFKVNDTVTCVARWSDGTYRVRYYPGNNGTIANGSQQPGDPQYVWEEGASYGSNYMVKQNGAINIKANPGYLFNKWRGSLTPDGKEQPDEQLYYEAGSTFTYKIEGDLELTAQWTPYTGKVTYNCGGLGGTAPNSVSVHTGMLVGNRSDRFYLPETANGCKAANNYTLLGWMCDHDLSTGEKEQTKYTQPIQPAKIVVKDNNDVIDCEAIWEKKTYKLTYAKGAYGKYMAPEAESVPVEVSGQYNTTLTLKTLDEARIEPNDGYKFDGWKCGNETGLRQPDTSYVIKNNVTCTAQWSPKSYKISYNSNGGSGSMPNTLANYKQQNVVLSKNKFTYDKRFFTGWNCVADEGGATVYVNSSTNNNVTTYTIDEMPASNVTCDAQWNQYTVTYFGCVDSFETCTGENQKELSSSFEERTKYAPGDDVKYPTAIELGKKFKGYTFDGKWYLTKSSNYPAGLSTSGRSVDLILYTVMKTLYSVNYKCDENGEVKDYDKYTKNSVATTKKNICDKKEGYEFVGWDCDNSVGKVAAEGTFTMPPNDVTCTARIEPSVYTLIYDCGNNKQILHNDNALTMDKSVDLIDYAKCQNTGYDLTGWDCKKDNVSGDASVYVTETSPEEDDKIQYSITMPANNVTCTAKTTKKQFTLSYKCENADDDSPGAPESQFGQYLDKLPLEQNTCKKTGSSFKGWGCTDNKTYKPDEQIVLKADTVCKSQWNTDKYKVTYKCGDDGEVVTGNPPTDNEQYTYGDSVTTKLIGTCQKTGNQFTKWKCGDTEVVAGGSFSITQPVTCIAQWSENTYKVIYKHGLYGTGEDYIDNVEFGTGYSILTANDARMRANTGYEFDVWECSPYLGDKKPDSTITMPARDITCTAKWNLIKYAIHYDQGEGTGGSMLDKTPVYYHQQNVLLDPNKFTYDKHFFTGWNCVADEGGATVSVTSSTNNNVTTYKIDEMPASDVTCTAQWNQYTVTYFGCVDSFETCTGENQKELSSYFEERTKYAPGDDVKYPTAIELGKMSGFKGYTFDGKWYLTRSSNYPAGLSTNGRNVSLILYTVMLQDQYTITYKPGQAGERTVSGEDEVRRVVYGGTQYIEPAGADLKTLSANTFSITGYSFDKWMSDKDVATGDSTVSPYTEYDANVSIAPYNVIGNTEMTAQWTPNHYTVTYIIGEHAQYEATFIDTYDEDTQSGGATYDENYSIYDGIVTAIEPIDGYEFVGWTTDSTPSFTNGVLNNQWNGETPWTRDDNLTVYAAYKPATYTINYNCGIKHDYDVEDVSGTPPALQNVEYMGEYSLAENENECVLPGSHFIGWRCSYDLDDGHHTVTSYLITPTENIVEKTGTFKVTDGVICAALWNPYEYNVTYDCGDYADEDSVAPTDEISYYYRRNVDVKGNLIDGDVACVRKNYEFSGWNCGDDIGIKQPGDVFEIVQDTICVANWKDKCCDVNSGQYLDTETGTCKTKPEHSHFVGDSCPRGYECDTGYKLTNDGNCEINETEIKFVCRHDIYRIRKGFYGMTEIAPGEELCCDDGYCEMYGWDCDNGERYDVGENVDFLDDGKLTCFADIEFNIHYQVYATDDEFSWNRINQVLVGGDTVNVANLQPDKYRLDEPVAYPQISLQGYTFEGWYDYFDGEDFDDRDKVTETPDYNDQGELWIYGKLVKETPCMITYHGIQGADNTNNPDYYMLSGNPVNLNSPEKPYYRFNGWHLGSSNGQVINQIVPDGSTCGIDLYAEWEFECNEKGHEHWLHVGDNENDKICLYEDRPYQNAPVVVIKGTNTDMSYYMMLSNDQDTLMHEGSNKKLRVMHNGTPYNACDMSTCAP